MALTVAQAVTNEVQDILLDPNGVFWSTTYLVNAYNIIVTAIIGDNPKVLTKVVSFSCADGVDQICPADATMFLRAPANINGTSIRQVTAEALSEDVPSWYQSPPNATIRHIVADQFDFLRFRVWPPSKGAIISLQYGYAPNDIATLGDLYVLPESYRSDCRLGILGMAYAKNTDRQDLAKAQYYWSQLKATTATKIQVQEQLATKAGSSQTTE